MKKIIRLTESELVSLVKRTIMEDNKDDYSIQSDIITYQGNNKDILKLQQILRVAGGLSPEQLSLAKNILTQEKESPVEVSKIPETPKVKEKTFCQEIKGTLENNWTDANKKLKSLIIGEGEKTYLNIKNTDKKYLYSLGDYEFNTPNEKWIKENIDSLVDLEIFLSDKLQYLVSIKKLDETKTLKEWIEFFNKKLNYEPEYFTSIVKKDDKSWTELPKIDTNYTNWCKWIDKLNENNKLGNGDKFEKSEIFFKQQPIEQVITNDEDLKLIKSIKNVKIPTISFAEYELFKDGKYNYYESRNSISYSTNKGNKAEREFIEYLTKNNISNNHIINFSTPGNQVDMIFGIDYIVKLSDKDGNYTWIPIQVKSSENLAKTSALLYNGLYGLSVFKSSKDTWYYFTPGKSKYPKSFKEDFFGN